MSFDQFESSNRGGSPTELYVFKTSEDEYVGYTNGDKAFAVAMPLAAGGTTAVMCAPTPIDRGEIKSTSTSDDSRVDVKVPRDSIIAQVFRPYPPSYVVTLTIFRLHAEDASGQTRQFWYGRVLGSVTRGVECTLNCDPFSTQLQQPGLMETYSFQCPLVLYGPMCLATKTPFELTVLEQNQGLILATPASALSPALPEYFVPGTIEWMSPRREIRRIVECGIDGSDVVIRVSGPTDTLAVDQALTLFKGCTHTEASCTDRFANILNFGGFPFIPYKNPVGKISTFF